MKFTTRLIAAACMLVLAGSIITPAVQAGTVRHRQTGVWKVAMIWYEKLVDRWAGSLGVSVPAWVHVDDDALVCGAVLPMPTGAGYCIRDDTVYISMEAVRNWEDAGKLSLLFITSHEFGHHLQDLGTPDKAAFAVALDAAGSVAVENQANCVAGVIIRWTSDNALLPVTDADIERLEMRMLAGVEDAVHGSARAMYNAFVLGERTGNIETCQAIGVPLAVSHGANH